LTRAGHGGDGRCVLGALGQASRALSEGRHPPSHRAATRLSLTAIESVDGVLAGKPNPPKYKAFPCPMSLLGCVAVHCCTIAEQAAGSSKDEDALVAEEGRERCRTARRLRQALRPLELPPGMPSAEQHGRAQEGAHAELRREMIANPAGLAQR
jgi:hypothetical protein